MRINCELKVMNNLKKNLFGIFYRTIAMVGISFILRFSLEEKKKQLYNKWIFIIYSI